VDSFFFIIIIIIKLEHVKHLSFFEGCSHRQ
jgi:hypothetical protein